MSGYDWTPDRAAVLASIDLEHPETTRAIEHLSQAAGSGDSGLPIDVAFALTQWSWQVPLVQQTLREAGYEPAELVYLRTIDGLPAWVWTSTCDLEQSLERVRDAWGVHVRRALGAVIGSVPEEPRRFAYDVVFVAGDRIALVPAGMGARLADVLGRTRSATPGLGDAPPVRALLGSVEPAPVRAVVSGQALLEPHWAAQTDVAARRIRSSGDAVDITAILPAEP
jgi:hypothetical protein